MRLLDITLAAASFSSSLALVIGESSQSHSSPSVLSLPVERRREPDLWKRDRLWKRQNTNTFQQTLDNLGTLYFVNASIGTPGQGVRLHLDTGSSDLWVNTDSSDFCQSSGNSCSDAGTYSANKSSSYRYVNSEFNITYVDGSGALGDYARDTLQLNNQEFQNMQFGIGYRSTSSEGILGIGFSNNEVQVNKAGGQPYPNLPQLLVNQGLTKANAFSLWLNDLDANTGSILFGGVDTKKYTGQLQTIPIIPRANNVFTDFYVAATAIGMNGQQASLYQGQPFPVLLDSGSSLIYLPDNLTGEIYRRYSAQYNNKNQLATIDCSAADPSKTLDFEFSGVTIRVGLDELVLPAGRSKGREICVLGINPAGGNNAVLGDTFLRSAYVVYDLDNNTISMAQTDFNATDTDIREVTKTSGIPDAVVVPNAVSSVPGGIQGSAKTNGRTSYTVPGAASVNQPSQVFVLGSTAVITILLAVFTASL